jgi:hypothetical protein
MLAFFQKHVQKYRADHNNLLYKSDNTNVRVKVRDPLPQNDEECEVALEFMETKKQSGFEAIKRKTNLRKQIEEIQAKQRQEKQDAKDRRREAIRKINLMMPA